MPGNEPQAPGVPIGPEIAVIGMAGRFPGAPTVEAFWRNLCDGADSIQRLSEADLVAAGVPAEALASPRYVRASGLLEDVDAFDAAFFGVSPREAAAMDPQHRVFLECAYEALDHSGYGSATGRPVVGVFAGASANTYVWNVYADPASADAGPCGQGVLGNDRDFLATRVSYKLDLTGPSLNVQTACSTSLVAIHVACQSILHGECAMAIAGGVSIRNLQREGYWFDPGGILSPDGRCRAFDADASGTVVGDGAGVVVLKGLHDAVADGDTIYGVIAGSAINNDGASKAGYTAPGPRGQAAVIADALGMAGVSADSIGYVECHGTGTRLGDPIEIAALAEAFRADTARTGFCAVGSVKTNIGHLDAAAGVAGLIKALLCLHHGVIPPSLHYTRPNAGIDFDRAPFYVNRQLAPWRTPGHPRRAGVSSFGIGGTNAHVILEQAPEPLPGDAAEPWQILVLSAKTGPALAASTHNLSHFLRQERGAKLADIAFTLQTGRSPFAHRRAIVCRDVEDALTALTAHRWADGIVDGGASSAGLATAALDLPVGLAVDGAAPAERDRAARLGSIAAQWLAGIAIDWPALHAGTRRRRLAVPTYPFERQRHWIAAVRRWEELSVPACGAPVVRAEPGAHRHARPELPRPYVAPATPLEQQLSAIWSSFFGYDRVGMDDDFFDLGGDSAGAVELTIRLARELGDDLPMQTLIEASTIASLARTLSVTRGDDGRRVPNSAAPVTRLKDGCGPHALFCIHPAGGGLFCYRHLARVLRVPDAMWGLDAEAVMTPGTRIEDLAAVYIEMVCRVQPGPPYSLLGFSMGGAVAYEMARQLRARDRAVSFLGLIDTMCPHQIPAWCDDVPETSREDPDETGDRFMARYAAHAKALRAYRPGRSADPVVFYRARERAPNLPAHPELPWIELADRGVEVHVIPGGHRTMLDLPGVTLIADSLERRLPSGRTASVL